MRKYLPEFLKYIFTSSKDWTGVWSLRYRNLCTSIASRGNNNLAEKISTIIAKLFIQRKAYIKSATGDKYILGILEETRTRVLSLLIISKGSEHMVKATHQGTLF
jgi:hypothetical protein